MTPQDKQFLIECLAKDMAEMLVDDFGWDIHKALSVLYNSKTFAKIEDEATGLYYQGSVYVYNFLLEELKETSNIDDILKAAEDPKKFTHK